MRKGRRRVIKAVLFDFDGVLTIEKTGSAAITEYIAKRCGLPAEQMGIRTLLFDEARDFPRFLAQLEAALAR